MNNRSANLFLSIFIICSFTAISFVGIFNYVMDPYSYFKTAPLFEINKEKLPAHSQERFDRVVNIISKKPQAILFGSSRIRAGIPTSYFSQITHYNAYKAAFAGARFNEIFSYFEHALHNQPNLKTVFIGLDFFAFSEKINPIEEFSERRMRKSTLLIDDLFKLLLSQVTLKFSYATYQHNLDPKKFEMENRIHVKVDEHDYIDLGPPMIDTPEVFLRAEKRTNFDNYKIDPQKIEMFRKIVQICKEKNIDLKVIICPAHAYYWETIYQSGRWEDLENFKRQVSAIYPVYDFSGFSPLNSENLLKERSGIYLFEISHFTPHYGKIILDKIYGIADRCPQGGFLLTAETVEEQLKILREQRQGWIQQNPEQVAWLQKQLEMDN